MGLERFGSDRFSDKRLFVWHLFLYSVRFLYCIGKCSFGIRGRWVVRNPDTCVEKGAEFRLGRSVRERLRGHVAYLNLKLFALPDRKSVV